MRAGGGNAGQGLGGAPGLGHLSSREGARALGNTIFCRGQGRGAKARWVFPTPPLGRPPPPGFLVPKSKVKLLGVSSSGLLSGPQGRRSALAPPSAALAPPPSRLQLRPDTPRANWRGGGGVLRRREDGISQRWGSGFPAILSVYGEKGEMEKAGRRRLAFAAPPLGRLRRPESRADTGGPGSLVRSGLDDAPRSGASRPGSSLCHRQTSGPWRARFGRAGPALRTEWLGRRSWSARAAKASRGRR